MINYGCTGHRAADESVSVSEISGYNLGNCNSAAFSGRGGPESLVFMAQLKIAALKQ